MAPPAFITVGLIGIAFASCAFRPDSSTGVATTSETSRGDDTSPESTNISFTVVDGRSGKPIADADVLWEQDPTTGEDAFDGRSLLESLFTRMQPDLDLLESHLTERGSRVRSDAKGFVLLPGSEFPFVFCRHGALIGSTRSLNSDKTGAMRLSLWPDGDIRVQVVDANGRRLAGTDVMLESSDESHRCSYAEQRATTDSDGLAILHHARFHIASDRSDSNALQSWRVAVECIPKGAASYELDSKTLPREPVTIRMPSSGAVEVEVREADGDSSIVDLPIGLLEFDAERSGWTEHADGNIFRRQSTNEIWTTLVDGKARFEHIAPGHELIAYAARNEASRVHFVQFAGPKQIGDTVRASMVLGADSVILTGRASGRDGAVLAKERVRVSLYGAPSPDLDLGRNFPAGQARRGPSGTLMTDAAGRFTVEFATDAASHGRPFLLIEHRRSDGVVQAKCVALQDVWSIGHHDIGDSRVREVPIMAAGVVVDESGAPIPGVWMCVERGALHSIDEFQTNGRGEFEWRSAVPHDEVRLEISKKGYLDLWPRSVAEPGRTDWRIVLQKASSIVGRVLLPVGADHRDYSYSVRRQDETAGGRFTSGGGDIELDGTFSWENCEQGTYSLMLRSVRENEFAPFQFDGIEVRKGQRVDLGVIDLRGAFRPVRLGVVAPDGSLVAGAFTYGPHGSDLLEQLRTTLWPREFSDGGVTIARNGEEELDIALAAPGMRTKVFREVLSGEVLRMEPGLQVQITPAKRVSKPPEGQRLLLGLFSPDADPRAIVLKGPRWPTEAFDSQEGVKLLAPAPGAYRLRWILERGSGMQLESRYWQEPPQSIELTDTSKLQRFDVVCPIDPATAWRSD